MILMLLCTNSFSVFNINSTILANNQHYLHHFHLFLAPEVGNSSQWILCYRQSSHGGFDSTFHKNCDGKENTVTIVQEKEFVFGGYTDIPWGNCNCFIAFFPLFLPVPTSVCLLLPCSTKVQSIVCLFKRQNFQHMPELATFSNRTFACK